MYDLGLKVASLSEVEGFDLLGSGVHCYHCRVGSCSDSDLQHLTFSRFESVWGLSGCHIEIVWTESLDQPSCLTVLEAGKSQVTVPGDSAPGESRAHSGFSMWARERECELSGDPSSGTLALWGRGHLCGLNFNYCLPWKIITLGFELQCMNLKVTQFSPWQKIYIIFIPGVRRFRCMGSFMANPISPLFWNASTLKITYS